MPHNAQPYLFLDNPCFLLSPWRGRVAAAPLFLPPACSASHTHTHTFQPYAIPTRGCSSSKSSLFEDDMGPPGWEQSAMHSNPASCRSTSISKCSHPEILSWSWDLSPAISVIKHEPDIIDPTGSLLDKLHVWPEACSSSDIKPAERENGLQSAHPCACHTRFSTSPTARECYPGGQVAWESNAQCSGHYLGNR